MRLASPRTPLRGPDAWRFGRRDADDGFVDGAFGLVSFAGDIRCRRQSFGQHFFWFLEKGMLRIPPRAFGSNIRSRNRSEERSEGQECISKCRRRRAPDI